MKLICVAIFACCLSSFGSNSFAQTDTAKNILQFSGVVLTGDSLLGVPFTHVIIKNVNRGTTTDFNGYFSFVALSGDTVEFSCIGFKKGRYIIPDTLKSKSYSLIQILSNDTMLLDESIIYPWPTKEQFKWAFIHMEIPDDQYTIAMKNLNQDKMRMKFEYMAMDGSMNYSNFMTGVNNKLYYAGGQTPINKLLDPFAWAKFIQAWRAGDFKKKKKN
ncbi:MAG: carboxypeptidase-like regulatory domain-containing protein [Flavobacteriales bacterium]|nr:carboxypeptidase-like regulatory domain-containing protein [Flavobacteriales bacterium]